MKTNFSVFPIIRADKKRADGRMPIYIQVIINGKTFKKSINEFIFPNQWDQVSKRIKKNVLGSGILNESIELRISDLKTYLRSTENGGKTITFESVKSFYEGEKKYYLYEFWEEQMKTWQGVKESSTLINYRTTLNRLKEFSSSPILADINYDFIERFDYYLKSVRGNTLAGANTRHKCLKSVLRSAWKKGLLLKVPYSDFELKKMQGRKIFLTEPELKKVMDFKFDKQHLSEIRDMYVFACFTGLRISDVTGLKWESIKGDCLSLYVKKTKKHFTTGLINICIDIINKYKGRNHELVFNRRAHQNINYRLKDIAKLVKVDKAITFHSARHTFAYLLKEKGFHMFEIKEYMGHENITVTTNYLHSLKENQIARLKVLEGAFH